MSLDRYAPELVWMSPASVNDNVFLGQLEAQPGNTYVFDKGYHNYELFKEWTAQNIYFVTRLKETAQYKVLNRKYSRVDEFLGGGVISDEIFA